jgi:ABC transporter DrrB family efflux protein
MLTAARSSPGAERTGAPVVEVEGLGKRFGDRWAVRDVTFAVGAGRVVGLLGPNGAGKTTTVRMLATLSRPDRGHAWIAGLDVVEQAGEVRRRISLAGQYAAVDPQLTGRENLRLVGRLQHLGAAAAAARADQLLAEFGLADVGSQPARTYSGGMRRRLDLAAAVVHRPAVLFLDEPTTGLDPSSRVRMWSAVRSLVGSGTAVVLTTQYLEEADRLCDELVVVDRGAVVATGTPDELKRAVGGDVLELVVDGPLELQRAATVTERATGATAAVDLAAGRVLVPVGHHAGRALAATARAFEDHGIVPVELGVRRPSLDEVFEKLTGPAPPGGGPVVGEQRRRPAGSPASDRSHRQSNGPSPLGAALADAGLHRSTTAGATERRSARCPVDSADGLVEQPATGLDAGEASTGRVRRAVGDWGQVAWRNTLHVVRQPINAVFLLVQPVLFVLMFRYVFGGALALAVGRGRYVEFLLPGIVAQTMAFGSMSTAVGLAEDLGTGMVDRIRSLPVARSAVLAGRLLADAGQYVAVMAVMVGVGGAVGFRFEQGPVAGLAMGGLALAFGLVASAFSALIGIRTEDPQAAMTVGLTALFPVCFVSGAFVPVATLPGWLQPVARANPVTVLVEAMRALAAGGPAGIRSLEAAAWLVGMAALFVPLAVGALRRSA